MRTASSTKYHRDIQRTKVTTAGSLAYRDAGQTPS